MYVVVCEDGRRRGSDRKGHLLLAHAGAVQVKSYPVGQMWVLTWSCFRLSTMHQCLCMANVLGPCGQAD